MLGRVLRELFAGRGSQRALARAWSAFEAGQVDEAERLCTQLTLSAPHLASAHHLRGLLALRRGDPAAAAEHLQRATLLNDLEPSFHAGLAEALRELGAHEGASQHWARALELAPPQEPRRPDWTLRLAAALQELKRFEEAEALTRRVLAHEPERPEALLRLASLRFFQSDGEQARALIDRYVAARPEDAAARLRRAMMMPVILDSNEEIDALRARLEADLERLLEAPLAPIRRPETEVGLTPFYIAYHGRESRDILRKFARAYRAAYPARTELARRPARGGRRLRIGFVSTFFYAHSVGRTTFGLLRDLPREHFETHVFAVAPYADATAQEYRAAADRYVALPADLEKIRPAIEAAELDALLFADIGMHPVTTFLSLWRLAPLQLATWGHSVTSGIDTVDYYVSADQVEAAGSEQQYSEKLMRLPGYFMPRYHRPVLEGARKSRGELGLPEDRHLYYCPQSLFKLHPDFDAALRAILERDPRGEIVLLDPRRSWVERLRARLARTLGPAAARVRFLPPMPQRDFLQALAATDLVIDPFHFGGCNTSCEAFSLGIPVVTLPAAQLPGRFTSGLYREMGLDACIAGSESEFVDIAVRLGTEPDFRRTISAQIAERAPVLFERADAGRALGEALLKLLA